MRRVLALLAATLLILVVLNGPRIMNELFQPVGDGRCELLADGTPHPSDLDDCGPGSL
jgi:hypothetical protein